MYLGIFMVLSVSFVGVYTFLAHIVVSSNYYQSYFLQRVKVEVIKPGNINIKSIIKRHLLLSSIILIIAKGIPKSPLINAKIEINVLIKFSIITTANNGYTIVGLIV
jgi:hypothetical protein